MSELDFEEDKLISIDLETTIITIGAFILLALITYNDKLEVEKKPPIMTDKESDELLLFYRILIVIISLGLVFNSTRNRNFAIKKNMNLKPYDLQIIASIALVVAAVFALYAVIITPSQRSLTIIGTENPQA